MAFICWCCAGGLRACDDEGGTWQRHAGDALDVAVDVADLARSVPRQWRPRTPEMPA